MNIIELNEVKKQYNGNYVLKSINLTMPEGAIIGYIGPNGAGKSTTIKILTGIITDFEGTVNIFGQDIKKNALDIKRRIGYIPELAQMYDVLTPMEYLHFIGKLYSLNKVLVEEKANELLQLFELSERRNDRMTDFSKGMKQKVLIISGLLHNPELIFLDEPLSGLDANAVIMVKEILVQLKNAGKTILYSSHIMDVVEKISDRIIIINKGAILADGSFNELQHGENGLSLENIFSTLTGSKTDNEASANKFIEIIKG